jgi:hypothetical protein
MNRWELSRRRLLRDLGLGAACLPLLHAGQARGAAKNTRLVIVASIYGYRTAYWQPKDGPLAAPLPKSVAPLEPHLGDLLFLHDMANPAFTGCNACGEGAYGVMYCAPPPLGGTGQYYQPSGPSVDQVIARALGPGPSGRPSFHAAVQTTLPPSVTSPGGRLCFWAGKQAPINPEMDPYKSYMDLFAGLPSANPADLAAVKKLLAERKSILDYVGGSLNQFKTRLGTEDKLVMDEHAAAIRELETQLQSVDASPACAGPSGGVVDLQNRNNYPIILDAFVNIIVAALKCGVTRVATLQLADAHGENINFAFVPGIPAAGTGYKTPYRYWGDLAHNPVLGGVDHKQILDQWWMAKLAQIIDKMKAVPDPAGGTLLDSSVILWGNNMHDGGDHNAQKVPWLLAGKCGGYFKTSQCLGGNTTTMVLADICQAMGVSNHPFGATYPGVHA